MRQEHEMTPGVLVPCDVTEMCPGDLRLRVRCLEDEVERLRDAAVGKKPWMYADDWPDSYTSEQRRLLSEGYNAALVAMGVAS